LAYLSRARTREPAPARLVVKTRIEKRGPKASGNRPGPQNARSAKSPSLAAPEREPNTNG
jgi:hypothetical protein